ncbi:MAG: NAD(+) diphosphatase [Alphaproteobacteria bacterium]
MPLWRLKNLVDPDESAPRAAHLTWNDVDYLAGGDLAIVFLGIADDAAYFGLDVSELNESASKELAGRRLFTELRTVGPLLPAGEGALLAYARGMLYWHSRHKFCGRCGGATKSLEGGHRRLCERRSCRASHFPRVDPAVIVLVSDGDRCLLGRQPRWPAKLYSALAGFVEPGESLEEAVAREVKEETGVTVRRIRYHSSQPWPFPGSLMLGFTAEAATTEIELDRNELQDARWVARDALDAAATKGVRLPHADSLARRLIDGWLAKR